jgi:hypothetical protein
MVAMALIPRIRCTVTMAIDSRFGFSPGRARSDCVIRKVSKRGSSQ